MVQNGLGRKIAIAVWVILGITLISKKIRFGDSTIYTIYMALFVLFCINTYIVGTINDVEFYNNHFFQPVIIASLVFFVSNILGYEISKEDLKKICIAYFYSMAIISIPLFIFYLRGTDLSSSVYEYRYGKNEISVLIFCALVISLTIYQPKGFIQKLIRIIAIAFFVIDEIFLRARSVLLCLGLLICILIFCNNTINKRARFISIASVFVILLVFYFNPNVYRNFISQIVYAGRDANSISDLSSGRSDTIITGIEIFLENPLFGVGKRGTIDCFYVSILASDGLLGLPGIIMALMPFVWSIRNLKNHSDVDLCFFSIAASLFLISILEELAPFGPGTRCYILWLMWGILLVNNQGSGLKQEAAQKLSRYIRS